MTIDILFDIHLFGVNNRLGGSLGNQVSSVIKLKSVKFTVHGLTSFKKKGDLTINSGFYLRPIGKGDQLSKIAKELAGFSDPNFGTSGHRMIIGLCHGNKWATGQ